MNAVTLLSDAALAAVPAIGFGMLFNVPLRFLPYCGLGGAVAHSLRLTLVQSCDMPIEWATFIAAAVVSFAGVLAAPKLRVHPKTYTVAAMIPMVPGVAAYTAIIAVVQMNQRGVTDALVSTAIQSSLRVFFIVAALAVGLALPGLTIYRRRPVV